MFGAIKGLEGSPLTQRVDTLIADLGLGEKRGALAGTLSGGQKRRLSLAVAMVGMPRFLIVDEGTSGLDPGARRAVWAMIQKYKHGRVIVFLTHHMDEADLLGDRGEREHVWVCSCIQTSPTVDHAASAAPGVGGGIRTLERQSW